MIDIAGLHTQYMHTRTINIPRASSQTLSAQTEKYNFMWTLVMRNRIFPSNSLRCRTNCTRFIGATMVKTVYVWI